MDAEEQARKLYELSGYRADTTELTGDLSRSQIVMALSDLRFDHGALLMRRLAIDVHVRNALIDALQRRRT
jgi:hypothetical protein